MQYEDEKIAALRIKEKKKHYNNTEKGIYIGEQLYKFSESLLFGETIRILLPDGFLQMPVEKIRGKYPSEFRPQVIISNESGMVNFTFSRFEQPASWEQLPDLLINLQTAILNMNPSVLVFHRTQIEVKDKSVPWMDFKSYAMDGALYNYLFLYLSDKKPVLGMFNCPFSEREGWQYLFTKCLETIDEVMDLNERG